MKTDKKLIYQRTFEGVVSPSSLMCQILRDTMFNTEKNFYAADVRGEMAKTTAGIIDMITKNQVEQIMHVNYAIAELFLYMTESSGWEILTDNIKDSHTKTRFALCADFVADMCTSNMTRVMLYEGGAWIIGNAIDYDATRKNLTNVKLFVDRDEVWDILRDIAVSVKLVVAKKTNTPANWESQDDLDAEKFKENMMKDINKNNN